CKCNYLSKEVKAFVKLPKASTVCFIAKYTPSTHCIVDALKCLTWLV
ncbi:6849_t:CDS:1, partial [Racocetra persica]